MNILFEAVKSSTLDEEAERFCRSGHLDHCAVRGICYLIMKRTVFPASADGLPLRSSELADFVKLLQRPGQAEEKLDTQTFCAY